MEKAISFLALFVSLLALYISFLSKEQNIKNRVLQGATKHLLLFMKHSLGYFSKKIKLRCNKELARFDPDIF